MFQTTRNRLPNIVLVIYCAIYLFVLMDLLLIDRRPSLDYLSVSLPNWILAPPGVAMLIWLRLFSQKSRCSNGPMIAINNPLCLSHPAKAQMALSQKKRFFLACLLLLGLQFLMTYCIWFYVGFDVGIVRISAQYAAAGDVYPLANAYFGTNPNNLGIYFLTILFLRLGDFLHMDGYLLL